MIVQPFKHTQRIIIEPGEFYVSTKQEVISTLLGSCVSACLFDETTRIIGMNHFLLAYRHHSFSKPSIESEEGRYGMYAMELLINTMMAKGARRNHIKAKCFGGGDVLHLRGETGGRRSVGGANIDFIREFLANENIPMVGSALGGKHGRNVHFVGDDNSVYVKDIGNRRDREVEKQERRYWKKSIKEHEQEVVKTTTEQAEFW